MTAAAEKTLAKVELYNYYRSKCKFPSNGWLVRHYLPDGRGTGHIITFKDDEDAAREYARVWNDIPS